MVATIADRFHQLPSVVARSLDEDPEMLDAECLIMLSYAQAKAAYDKADSDEDLKGWEGSKVMSWVVDHDFEYRRRRLSGGQ